MTRFLRKIFIKDFEDVNNPKVREKHGILACVIGLISNLILVAIKITIGVITHSLSIISDSINNLSDCGNGTINLVCFKLANKPADKKHPFGHQRIEYVAGLIISFVVIALAAILGYSSVMKIVNRDNITEYNFVTFIILGVAILIKLWQGLFYRSMAKAINSVSLKANSQDSFSDVLSTIVVLICALVQFLLSKYVPESKPYLYLIDGIAGILVACIILALTIKLIFEISDPLIGAAPDVETVKKIVDDIKQYKGVLGVHDLVVHSYGPTSLFITIHVEIDAREDVLKSHELIDKIELEVSKKYHIELTIHMDPIITDSEEINSLRAKIKEIIDTNFDNEIRFHDLRIVSGKNRTNVLFDVEIPFEYKYKDDEIIAILKEELNNYNKKYCMIIKVDHSI